MHSVSRSNVQGRALPVRYDYHSATTIMYPSRYAHKASRSAPAKLSAGGYARGSRLAPSQL